MTEPVRTEVLIVGAGFGGVAMAIELRRAGIHDFVVLEKAADLGGVWRENTYPGAGCDVPSPLYSFSFARNPDWPRRYAAQPDILSYLDHTARSFGATGHIRFRTEVASADFDTASGRWRVRTTTGAEYSARVFVPAAGQLSRPAYPAIPGAESFLGDSFHSAEWDHECALRGKRIAVIGTGASAIQFVPRIQPDAAHVALFQRTAPYIMPKRDHAYKPWHHKAFRIIPPLQTLDRLSFWLYADFAQQCLSKWQRFIPLFRRQTSKHLRESVPDQRLREVLTPDYEIGCKRVLFSNDYLPAVCGRNVDIVTEPIAEITPGGVRTAGGAEYEVDVIIYGTGFASLDLLAPMRVHGAMGTSLAGAWHEGARAYLGISVPGFPNMFLMYGPNTNLGGGSIIYMLESQARYIRTAVESLRARPGTYVDVRPDAEQRWDSEVQGRLEQSVWTRCSSWYRNEHGRVVTNWPGRTREYRKRTRRFDPEQYRVGVAADTRAQAASA